MPADHSKDTLEMGKTFTALVRIHEANCEKPWMTDEQENFATAIMKKIGLELGLGEVRRMNIDGPGKGAPRPPAPAQPGAKR